MHSLNDDSNDDDDGYDAYMRVVSMRCDARKCRWVSNNYGEKMSASDECVVSRGWHILLVSHLTVFLIVAAR